MQQILHSVRLDLIFGYYYNVILHVLLGNAQMLTFDLPQWKNKESRDVEHGQLIYTLFFLK